ncbi:[FeFe] hydrogenase H-cluster maturation GTPase HydF [Bacteroidales bacterium OttesenSCG-928-K03]|nr:[FeFe] hydrogenase H-cluster maturation GTPase HydF [Odoribacter sp. OttesenSCG-928-L07]MDL2242633.1 [FeFe] hydrogenase H-cluster maturation GTPase HydF [Bacteroidales bacterium OttesenSCG-928-K03]
MKTKENKIHIGIFGRRNNGKSSFINAITGQDVAIVSDIPGTTTDPVKKSLEIHGFGPVVVIDTAGIDDSGELGIKRIKKTNAALDQIDVAILIIADSKFDEVEKNLINDFNSRKLPYVLIYNKIDVESPTKEILNKIEKETGRNVLLFSSKEPVLNDFVAELLKIIPETSYNSNDLFYGIIDKNDLVILVTPIDSAAPEGRLILPQVQAIRNILDHDAISIVCKETELNDVLDKYKIKPALVVTDSQVFKFVDEIVPENIPLTSFSIILARMKGNFEEYLKGTPKISTLKDGDKILILESCSHQATCEDIGRVKIPKMLRGFTKKDLEFNVISGFGEIPENIEDYALVIQCGGCMFTKKQLAGRLRNAIEKNIPITNYGMAISYMTGVFNRAVKIFEE